MKLTKNADPDKYGCSGFSIGFDALSQFSLPDGSWDKNVIIFGVDDSSFVHVDNKKKDVLVLGEGLRQRFDDTIIRTTKAKFSINFTGSGKRFVLSLHYNGTVSYLLMIQKYINSKQKIQK